MNIYSKSVIAILPFESTVLEAIASSQLADEENKIFRQQMEGVIIVSRKMTGHGFYTDFLVDERAPRFPKASYTLGNVGAKLPSSARGAGFVLFIREGVIKTLEGFVYEGSWPDPWPDEKIPVEIDKRI